MRGKPICAVRPTPSITEQNCHWHKELILIYKTKIMRKLFIAATMLFAVQVASAQSADFKKDMLEVISVSGTSANFTAFLDPIMEQIPEDKHADFKKDFEGSLPGLYEKMAEVRSEERRVGKECRIR